jgi:hypothetical protein
MPDQFIYFLQFAVRYSPLHSMDLPELQIDDILRYLSGDDNQESAPSLPHLMYQLPHLSHRLHRPVLLHLTRGWQPPLKDSLDLLKAIIQPSYLHEEGYSGPPSHLESSYVLWRRTSDDIQPKHCRGGKATFHHCTLIKVSTELWPRNEADTSPCLALSIGFLKGLLTGDEGSLEAGRFKIRSMT